MDTTVTDEEVREILADAQFLTALLEGKGARHMIGALTIATAAAYTATEMSEEEAIKFNNDAFVGSMEMFRDRRKVN